MLSVIMLNVTYKPYMLGVFMLSVVMLSVVAPLYYGRPRNIKTDSFKY